MGDPPRGIAQRLAAARMGSNEALGEVLEMCRRYLLWVARQELDPGLQAKGGASDLVQETFLEAHRDFSSFHGSSEDELLAWLRRLLLNNLSNFSRRYRGTSKRTIEREVSLEAGSLAGDLAQGLPATSPSPTEHLMEMEQTALLEKLLDRLPGDYRQVMVLWYREHQSFEEIGRRMDRSPNAARMLWLRAIERMQKEVMGEVPEDG